MQSLLCIGLLFFTYILVFRQTSAFSLQDRVQQAESTKTAVAGTVEALMGPFPTATLPSKTPTHTPTVTPVISATPTITATATHTPTKTPTRFVSKTPSHRNSGSQIVTIATAIPNTSVPPTDPPTVEPPPTDPPATEPSAPTDPPATQAPVAADTPAPIGMVIDWLDNLTK